MTKEEVDGWLAEYIAAWKTYDHDQIAALFTEEIAYRYHPYDDPIEGRDEVVKAWRAEGDHPEAGTRDDPGTYEASYETVAVDGDVAVATGWSSYKDSAGGQVARTYDNCFVMRFAKDGRCREFTEWFIKRPSP
ncbi:MAG TPA: nuclear transport factor 2 family protein [Solirubrobacterales bacterium]|nr:nuclear transport factor 2 family protein [Solirubrobacterales bacterium]